MKLLTKPKLLQAGKTALPYTCAFLVSFIIGIVLFAAKGIVPFGENSVLCMDMWGQYFPMYFQKATADTLSDAFYSWNGAFGYNNWAQNAYYCNSIFLLVLNLLPAKAMVNAVSWLCIVKIACSAATCLGLLRYKTQSGSPLLIGGAVAYSLCAYVLAFLSQFMWTDCLIYVPLILIGLERLVFDKKPLLYVFSLALAIYTSFYIGFAICMFVVLYFAVIVFRHFTLIRDENGKCRVTGGKAFGMSILRFAGFSLLGGGMTGAVILPVGAAISNTIAATLDAPTQLKWYDNIIAYMQTMLPGQRLYMEYDFANTAVGILIFLIVPIYFFNKEIRLTERIGNFLLLVLLYLSMNCNLLDYMWHGFHFPNQLPGRWTFLLSLMLVLLGCTGLAKRKGMTPVRGICGLVLGLLWLIVTVFALGPDNRPAFSGIYWLFVFAGAAFIVALLLAEHQAARPTPEEAEQLRLDWEAAQAEALAAAQAAEAADEEAAAETTEETAAETTEAAEEAETETAPVESPETADETAETEETETALPEPEPFQMPATISPENRKKARILAVCCACLFTLVWTVDVGSNFVAVSKLEEGGLRISSETSYTENILKQSTGPADWLPETDDFYRVEMNPGYTFNPSMFSDSAGMGYYSSTMNGAVFELLEFLGNRVYANNVSTVYNVSSTVQNGLFGIRYFLDYARNFGNALSGANLVYESEAMNVWENPQHLPLAYAVADTALDFEINDQIRGIQNQNTFLNALCGADMQAYKMMQCSAFSYENCHLMENSNWNANYFQMEAGQSQVVFHYTYICETDGPVYLEHNYRAGKIYVTKNGRESSFAPGGVKYRYLGNCVAGEEIQIRVEIEGVGLGCCGLNLYRLDMDAWNHAYETLNAHALDVTDFSNTHVTGQITMAESGLVMATIPQDGGWSVYCDGEELETLKVGNCLLTAEVPAGDHTLEYVYHVPGLRIGTALTVLCLLLTVAFGGMPLWKKLLTKKQ